MLVVNLDKHLSTFYGPPVKALVANDKSPGVYNTVYVDTKLTISRFQR